MSRVGAAARLARRDVARHPWRSLLAVVLIALPVAASLLILGGATTGSNGVTPDERVAGAFGDAQLIVGAQRGYAVSPGAQPPGTQPPGAQPQGAETRDGLAGARDQERSRRQVESILDSTVGPEATVSWVRSGTVVVVPVDSDVRSTMTLAEADWHAIGLAPKDLEGRMPAGPGEVALGTYDALTLGANLGDRITTHAVEVTETGVLPAGGEPRRVDLTVTGIVREPMAVGQWLGGMSFAGPGTFPDSMVSDAAGPAAGDFAYVTGVGPVGEEVGDALAAELFGSLTPEELRADQWAVPMSGHTSSSSGWDAQRAAEAGFMIAVLVTLAVLQMVLLVTPVFVVATERMQRTLALFALAGGRPRDIRRVVLLGGALLGLVGGLLGLALGHLLAVFVGPIAGMVTGGHYTHMPMPSVWLHLVVVLGAVLLGVLAALHPARSAARTELSRSLAGVVTSQVTPVRVARRVIVAGVLLAAAAALVVWYRTMFGTWLRTGFVPLDQGRTLPAVDGQTVGAVAVALLVVSLVVLAGPLLSLVGALLGRITVTARLAARDSLRRRSRAVPTIAAVTIVLATAVFAVTMAQEHRPDPQQNRVASIEPGVGTVWASGSAAGSAELEQALDDTIATTRDALGPVTRVDLAAVTRPNGTEGDLPWDYGGVAVNAVDDDECDLCPEWLRPSASTLVADGELVRALAADNRPRGAGWDAQIAAAARTLDRGGVVITSTSDSAWRYTSDDPDAPDFGRHSTPPGPVDVATTEEALTVQAHEVRLSRGTTDDLGAPVVGPESLRGQATLPAALLHLPRGIDMVLSPQAAEALDLETARSGVLLRAEEQPSRGALSGLGEELRTLPGGPRGVSATVPTPDWPVAATLAAIAVASVLIAGLSAAASVALSAAESRRDQRSLRAIGARPRVIRGFGAWQAALIGLCAAPAGLLGGMGAVLILRLLVGVPVSDQPWLPPWWLVPAVLIGAPLVCAAAGAAVSGSVSGAAASSRNDRNAR